MKQPSNDDTEFIRKAMTAFGFSGNLIIDRVSTGYLNKVYKTTTENGEYVIHIPANFNEYEVENEIWIHKSLSDTEILSASVLVTPEGIPYYCSDGQCAVVSPWVEGQHPQSGKVPVDVCYVLGKSLGLFHTNVSNLPHSNNRQLLKQDIASWEAEYTLHDNKVANELLDVAKALEGAPLPSGIVHGDFHVNNILIDDQNRIVILDMERVGEGVLLYDIARSIVDICSTGDTFDVQKSEAFLNGYTSIRPLTPHEENLYRPALAYASIAVANWFFIHGHLPMGEKFLAIGLSAQRVLK